MLAQQIVAEVAAREWEADGAVRAAAAAPGPTATCRAPISTRSSRCWRRASRTRRGRRGALIHHDAVNHRLRGRRGARLTALTSGGTIPDTADYQVLLEPENQPIGTVNEDFAVESLAGDVFQLGNTAYRILRVERGTVRVEDARRGAAEHPVLARRGAGAQRRTVTVGLAAARRDRGAAARRAVGGERIVVAGRRRTSAPGRRRAARRVSGRGARRARLRCRRRSTIVFERFFDEAGGMQLVIHSPYGSRINRAWGLALRKRFCRKFNFELQAAATEDNIVLSLTTAHSFELAEAARYLHSATIRPLLIQALLDAPMFTTRWRWVAGVALALPRFRGGKKVPAPLARMAAEDLVAAVFPDQVACAENLAGEREIPDHPLVRQTIADCLERGDGRRPGWSGCWRGSKPARSGSSPAISPSPRRSPSKCCRPGPTPSRRRAAGGAPHPGGDGAALAGAGGGR